MNPIYLFSTSSHPRTTNINSLEIKFFKPKIDFSHYDFFIITSKQVSKFLQQYNSDEYKNIPALCVSTQTALAYENLGGKVLEVGKGYGDTLIDKINLYPKDSNWLYIRAKVVASDFVSLSKKNGYKIDEVIAYESYCSEAISNVIVEENTTLIFTSPSSVKCFLAKHTLNSSHKIIVIGKTTAKALPDNVSYIISKETTIESCLEETY